MRVIDSSGSIKIKGPQPGGSCVEIAQLTANNSATLDFTGLTGYSSYLFVLSGILPVTTNTFLWVRTSTNNGSSFDAGANNYAQAGYGVNSAGGAGVGNLASGGSDHILLDEDSLVNTNTYGLSGEFALRFVGNGTQYGEMDWRVCFVNTVPQTEWCSGAAIRLAAGPINAVRFLFNSGNISSGTITVYGLNNVSGGIAGSPTGNAGGDLGGTYPNPTVTGLHWGTTGITLGAAGNAPTTNQLLGYNGTNIVGVNSVVRIAQSTASSSATLDFTSLSGYTSYLFTLQNIVLATNAASLYMRTTANGGTTWNSGANDYGYGGFGINYAGGSGVTSNSGGAAQLIIGAPQSNNSSFGMSGHVLWNMGGTSSDPACTYLTAVLESGGNGDAAFGSGMRVANGVINGVRFLSSSGNISSGTITVYGIS